MYNNQENQGDRFKVSKQIFRANSSTMLLVLLPIVWTGCLRTNPSTPESSIKATAQGATDVEYQAMFPEMPLRVYCGKAGEEFKPVIFLERYIRGREDPFYSDQKRKLKGIYRMFRIESAIDLKMGVAKKESLYRDGWSLWLDDIEAVYNRTPGHEGIGLKLSGEQLPLFLWFSLANDPQHLNKGKSIISSGSKHNLLSGLFGSSEKDIDIICKHEKMKFAPKAPAIDDRLTIEVVQKNGEIKLVPMAVDLLSYRQIRDEKTGQSLFAGEIASGFVLGKKTTCDPSEIDVSKIVGSHVFDQQGHFVGQVLEFTEDNGANTQIQLVNDRSYGRFYAKGQIDSQWSPQSPIFPPGKTFLMSETYKKYKDYISSPSFKQQLDELKSSGAPDASRVKSLKVTTQVKMLWMSRQSR